MLLSLAPASQAETVNGEAFLTATRLLRGAFTDAKSCQTRCREAM
jgi:hypothetical protein